MWASSRTQAQWSLAVINEWLVAFPMALTCSVWLARVAPDKENISCEYLCCLFKVQVRCLLKVIRVYIHSGSQRARGRQKREYQAAPLLLILTSLVFPFLFVSSQLWASLPHTDTFLLLYTLSNSLWPGFIWPWLKVSAKRRNENSITSRNKKWTQWHYSAQRDNGVQIIKEHSAIPWLQTRLKSE